MIGTMRERTKYLFAETLIEMLNEIPFDKIKVTELARRSGTAVPTFYYHFKDKYELVAWMYLKDFADVIGHGDSECSPEKIGTILQNMDHKKGFYKKVFTEDSKNHISTYIRMLGIKLAKEAVEKYQGNDVITEDQEIALSYYSYGVQGMIHDWIFSNNPMDVNKLGNFIYNKTPELLRN